MINTYELSARYDARKSFYGKAHVIEFPDGRKVLTSYDTAVAEITAGGKPVVYGKVYDCDIAERLCCPSELRRLKGGDRMPNSCEDWIAVQARALAQAAALVRRCVRDAALCKVD